MWNGMDPQGGSGNAGPPDQSCRHGGVDTEVQRAEAVLRGDRLVLRAPVSGPRATEGQRGGETRVQGLALCPAGEWPPR